MKVKLEKKSSGDSYEILVREGLYSGRNTILKVERDCYNEIVLYFYDYENKEIGKMFETFTIGDINLAKEVSKAIKILSKSKYKLNEPD